VLIQIGLLKDGHEYKTHISWAKEQNDWALIRVQLLGLLGHDNNTHINCHWKKMRNDQPVVDRPDIILFPTEP
jgi:hypothetical protein